MFKALAVSLLAATSFVGCSAATTPAECPRVSPVVMRGLCNRVLGFGLNANVVAVPCARISFVVGGSGAAVRHPRGVPCSV
jgi:hypothetical protein